MKTTTTALALALLATSATAGAAQYGAQAPAGGTQYAPGPTPPPTPTPAQKSAQPQAQSNQIVAHAAKVSKEAAKALQDLQAAVDGKDPAAIPAKLAAAQAAAKTADDRYLIGVLQLKAGAAAKDDAAIAAGIETMLASGGVTANESFPLYFNLGETYTTLKQEQKAADAFQHALQLNPSSLDATADLAEAKAALGQSADAVATILKGIALQQASGQKASESWYRRAVALAYQAKLPAALDAGRQWVAAYPAPGSWHDSVAIYRNLNQPDTSQTLDLLRLLRAVGALKNPADYAVYAADATELTYYAEAQDVIDEGIAAKMVNPASADFRETIAVLKVKPKATAADLDEAVKSAPAAKALIGIGDRYYALGDYAKAADLYRQAMAKGADHDVANLHLGMALARSGDKAGATAALNAATGAQAEIAKFWLLYLQRQG